MLINIENVSEDDVLNQEHSIAIENLLRSFAENKHILIAPRAFFTAVIKESFGIYSASTKAFATEALRGLMEYAALKKSISFYVSVDFSIKDLSYEWLNSEHVDKFKCGPLFFNDSSQLQKIKIIFENPLDSDFLKIIASYYARSEKLSRCSIGFNALNGGGGSTKSVFDREVQNNELTFCIVDNDKMHPRAPFGGTSSHFLGSRVYKSGMVKILDVHEIESLLPFDTIERVLEKLNLVFKKKGSLDFFKSLCAVDESAKFYFDHKKGFELRSALRLDKAHGDYWRSIIKGLNELYKCDCLERQECCCEPSCLSYEGFGDGLLSNALEYISRGNLRQYNPELPPGLKSKWDDVGKNFFSWSCGPYKKARLS